MSRTARGIDRPAGLETRSGSTPKAPEPGGEATRPTPTTTSPQMDIKEDNLHAAIMNLPADGSTLDWANTREAYLYGHRDARHAAAELVSAALSQREQEAQALRKDAERRLAEDDVQWVVNDIAELGVKIGDQFFFLYKGHSLAYGAHEDSRKDGSATHDDGSPMHWRPVFKREFGECCHPVNYEDLRKCGHPHYIGTVSLSDSDEWRPLPAAAIDAAMSPPPPDTGRDQERSR